MVRHSSLFSACRSRSHVFVRCLSCVTVSSLGSEVSATHPTAGPQGGYQEGAGGKGDRVGVFHSRTPLRCGQLSSLGGEGRQAAVATKAHAPKAVGKRCLVGEGMSPGNALEGNVGSSTPSQCSVSHFQAALMHMYHQRQQNREHMTALKPLLNARADRNLSPAFWLSRSPGWPWIPYAAEDASSSVC